VDKRDREDEEDDKADNERDTFNILHSSSIKEKSNIGNTNV